MIRQVTAYSSSGSPYRCLGVSYLSGKYLPHLSVTYFLHSASLSPNVHPLAYIKVVLIKIVNSGLPNWKVLGLSQGT